MREQKFRSLPALRESPPRLSRLPRTWRAALAVVALCSLVVAACSRDPQRAASPVEPADSAPVSVPVDIASIPDAVPRREPRSRYGNPESYEVYGKRYPVMARADGYAERGIASWYGTKFHGRRTSSGEPYDMFAMTAAHRSLPLPTYVAVTNLENGRRVVLRVNDRGPFRHNRIIDLSYAAAVKLGIAEVGTGLVEVRALEPDGPMPATPSAGGRPVSLYLQVGAFAAPDNARRLAAALERRVSVPVRLSTTVSNGRTLHRVRLGPLADVEGADALGERLVELTGETPRVVVD